MAFWFIKVHPYSVYHIADAHCILLQISDISNTNTHSD